MYRIVFFIVFFLLTNCNSQAQQKKALLIGINKYLPGENVQPAASFLKRGITNLDGPINDVKAIENIIVSKFGFNEHNISILLDENATRDNILNSIKNIIDNCVKGDVVFLFYAGHGSQVYNSLSNESDKKDESIVPSDSWKAGINDIRDKELAVLFNAFLDKGILLTVIFDCCHSGSLQRGPGLHLAKSRFAGNNTEDAKDPVIPLLPQANNNGNFLMLSASQDIETANEKRDNNTGQVQGVFTTALITAINQLSVQSSPETFLTAIRAILKSNGESQEPVMGIAANRKDQTLFGVSRAGLFDKTLVAVSGVEKDRVVLQGGFALGIYPKTALIKIKAGDTIILIVDSVSGSNLSLAKIKKGNKRNINPGEFFEVANWVASAAPLLNVYIPATEFTYDDIMHFVSIDNELKKHPGIRCIKKIDEENPGKSIFFDKKDFYINDTSGSKAINKMDLDYLGKSIKQGSSYYFELPADMILIQKIKELFSRNQSIALVNSADEANYVLYGITDENGNPSYGLRSSIINLADSLGSMPLQSIPFSLKNNSTQSYENVAAKVYSTALKIAKIKGWLQLIPPQAGKRNFPFHVELIDMRTKQLKKQNVCKLGETISFHLVLDKDYSPGEYQLLNSYLYIFTIDREGKMLLLFPQENGNNNEYSRFPFRDEMNRIIPDKDLFSYEVSEPVGTDNIFLLATDQPIANCESVFNQEGVGAIGKRSTDNNPMLKILNLGNEGYQARDAVTTERWTLMKLGVKSMH